MSRIQRQDVAQGADGRGAEGAGIEREVTRLALGGAGMFLLLSAALVYVLDALSGEVAVLDTQVVPTERSVAEVLDAMRDVTHRETEVLSAASVEEVEAAGDDQDAGARARAALDSLEETIESDDIGALRARFGGFLDSAARVTSAVRASHDVDARLAHSLADTKAAIGELLALVDGLQGEIELRYVLLLRSIAAEPSPGTVAELVHGDVRVQGERIGAARTQIEVLGRCVEQVALTRNRDELNALASNELAQSIERTRNAIANLQASLTNGAEAKFGARAAALASQLEKTVSDLLEGDGTGGLVGLRHAYFDALGTTRSALAQGQERTREADRSLFAVAETAHALATDTRETARSVVRNARAGVLLLVVLGLGACFVSGRRVLRALRALRQQNADLAQLRDELSQANEGLEARVAERTAELASREASTRLLLDSMGDALFKADAGGSVVGERSRATVEWFGENKDGVRVWELLPADEKQRATLELGWEQLADGFLPFEVAADQLPRRFERDGRIFDVEYRETGDAEVLVIARDWTAKVAAERSERDGQEFQALVGNLLEDREGFELVHAECEELLQSLSTVPNPSAALRVLHTLKGNTSSYGFRTVAEIAHAVEEIVREEDSVPSPEAVEDLQSAWVHSIARLERYLSKGDSGLLRVHAQEVDRLRLYLQRAHAEHEIMAFVDSWALTSAESYLGRLARQARRVAASVAKEVDVQIDADMIRVPDRIAPVWPMLVHLIRNAVDHGIEAPEIREAEGKPQRGTVRLRTCVEDDALVIEVVDDGAGVDVERLRARLAELHPQVDVDDLDLLGLLSVEGLSSKDVATEVSGRGIGVAAVVETVEELGGLVSVESVPGEGTCFVVSFPGAEERLARAA